MADYPMPDGETLLEIYRRAVLIKLNDERVIREIRAGCLVTPYYSPRGQEIIPAALCASLRDEDSLCTIYRGTHDMLAKGFPLEPLWAELAGRITGSCKGKGGTMHLTHPASGCMVTTGIVGSSMPIATGLGWAAQLEGNGEVAVACFGDGAANIGAFHESLNMAALWKLPVIYLCQNNLYAEHTTFADSTAAPNIADRAASYGMPGVQVDGNDANAMYSVARAAIDRARAGDGPTLIEAMTYRFNGHVLGDAGGYMDVEEKAAAVLADPVPALRAELIAGHIADEASLAAMEAQISAQIAAAVEAAYAAPYPDAAEMILDVYAQAS